MADKQFRVIMPNGYKKILFYNSESNKNKLIEEYVLKYWSEYLETHWLWQHAFNPYKLNYEDKNKAMLDRLGTFLLIGFLKEGMVITEKKQKTIYKKEIPASCTGSNIQDMIYGMDNGEDYSVQTNKNTMHDLEIVVGNIDEDEEQIKGNKRVKKSYKNKYNNSMQFKMSKLHNKPEIFIRELHKLKNSDVYGDYVPSNITDEEEIKKWKDKPFKNAFKENLYEVRKKKIKGNTKGFIDPEQPFISKWVYIDNDGIFEFNGNIYQLKVDSIKEYKPCTVTKGLGINMQDKNYSMDRILVVALCTDEYEIIKLKNGVKINKPKKTVQDMYFFDMNVQLLDKIAENNVISEKELIEQLKNNIIS